MADDEDDTTQVSVIPTEDQQLEEMRQRISQKYALIQQRLEQQAARLNDLQVRLEQQLSQKSGMGRWLTILKIRLYYLWWRLRHR